MENRTSAEAMSLLQSVCEKKKFISFKNISPGEFLVKNFSVVDTQHGVRIQIEVDNGYMYLPERFSVLSQSLDELNKSPKIMVYKGKDANDTNRLMLEFKDVEYFSGYC